MALGWRQGVYRGQDRAAQGVCFCVQGACCARSPGPAVRARPTEAAAWLLRGSFGEWLRPALKCCGGFMCTVGSVSSCRLAFAYDVGRCQGRRGSGSAKPRPDVRWRWPLCLDSCCWWPWMELVSGPGSCWMQPDLAVLGAGRCPVSNAVGVMVLGWHVRQRRLFLDAVCCSTLSSLLCMLGLSSPAMRRGCWCVVLVVLQQRPHTGQAVPDWLRLW